MQRFGRLIAFARIPRVLVGFITCLLIFIYLISTLTNSAGKRSAGIEVVYKYPEEILKRILRLEVKVDNFTRLFTQLTTNVAGKTIMTHFITSNIDSFWRSYQLVNTSAENINDLYALNDTTNHTTDLITTDTCGQNLKLLILITTHVSHFQQREVIRNTWGRDPIPGNKRWKTYFLIGRTKNLEVLEKMYVERNKFGDLVIGNVAEDFYNLTYKLHVGFEWAIKYCSFQFMLKGDDDVFINMPKMFEFLEREETPKTELYAGNVNYDAVVARTGKYGIDKEEFRKRIYPRYCSGGGFVLSYDVASLMNRLFHKVRPIKIDDVYIGEVALKGGIDVLHNENFKMFEDEQKCPYNPATIVHHPAKTEECMTSLYRESLKVR